MSYQFEPCETVGDGLRRIAAELIDDAVARTEEREADRHEVVHEVRKDCKKLRGLLRLVRPAAPGLYATENAYFRDAAAALSVVRDAEASIETYDALLNRFDGTVDRRAMAAVRGALTRHKQQVAETAGDLDDHLADFRAKMLAARQRTPDWELPKEDLPGDDWRLLGRGLGKTYKRGRKAMDAAYAEPSVERFHEWRKRAKYLRYHLRLLRPAWPPLLKRLRSEAKTLADLLGDDHDLDVLRQMLPRALKSDTALDRAEILLALTAQRSVELRNAARWLGLRVYAEKPKALRKRMHGYWSAMRGEQAHASGLDLQ